MTSGYCGNCPAEVADALTSILRDSILLIRMAGNGDDADYCAAEANHIHNLPTLLRCYERVKLQRYLSWAKTEYVSDFRERFHRLPTEFTPQWQRLEDFLRNTETV